MKSQSHQAHLGTLEARLKQWGANLDELLAKADDVGAEVKSDYRKSMDDLKAQYKSAQGKLDELKAAGSADWETFKTGVEGAWNELEIAFKKMAD